MGVIWCFMLPAFISVVTKQWNTVTVITRKGTFTIVIENHYFKKERNKLFIALNKNYQLI